MGPWLDEPRARIAAAHAAGHMPHALLIHAAQGTGGGDLAAWAAQVVLCERGGPCGECAGCRRAALGQHPDLTRVGLLEDSQQIRIEQIRELGLELALTSHAGGYKVAIIDPADTLNRYAANALLKTLEEPPARTLIVLVAAQPSRLPPTLSSRCLRVHVRAPTRAESLAWLERARGPGDWGAVLDVTGEAPVAAAALDPAAVGKLRDETWDGLRDVTAGKADPARLAEHWSRSELPLRLTCIENWLTDRIRRTLAGPEPHGARAGANPSRRGPTDARTLFERLDDVRGLKAALTAPINRSLALESLLRSWPA
ncbi:MAG: hypothetical protein ACREU3_05190 [Steroidobacteraceae bacterium]